MNNLPLQPLKWTQKNLNPLAELELTAYSALHEYEITEPKQGKFEIKKTRLGEPDKKSEIMTGFTSAKDAQDEAWAHYQRSMQSFVKPDSITDIRNWFKAAKPEPTNTDVIAQVACHLEEVDEFIDSMDIHPFTEHLEEVRRNCKKIRNKGHSDKSIENSDHLEMLDALADQIVTATGVAYMMGFDIEGALKEVIRSNNSKMVDGKFEFDANGKITKPESYSEPDLTPFISTMQILHKGE